MSRSQGKSSSIFTGNYCSCRSFYNSPIRTLPGCGSPGRCPLLDVVEMLVVRMAEKSSNDNTEMQKSTMGDARGKFCKKIGKLMIQIFCPHSMRSLVRSKFQGSHGTVGPPSKTGRSVFHTALRTQPSNSQITRKAYAQSRGGHMHCTAPQWGMYSLPFPKTPHRATKGKNSTGRLQHSIANCHGKKKKERTSGR